MEEVGAYLTDMWFVTALVLDALGNDSGHNLGGQSCARD